MIYVVELTAVIWRPPIQKSEALLKAKGTRLLTSAERSRMLRSANVLQNVTLYK